MPTITVAKQVVNVSGGTIDLSMVGGSAGDIFTFGVVWKADTGITCTGGTVGAQSLVPATVQTYASMQSQQFWAVRLSTGGTKAVQITFSANPFGAATVFAMGWGNCQASGAYFGAENATATGTSSAPSALLTTTGANSAILALCSNVGGGSGHPGAGTGYTAASLPDIYVNCEGEYDDDIGAIGLKSVAFTLAASTDWAVNAIELLDVSAGGGGDVLMAQACL